MKKTRHEELVRTTLRTHINETEKKIVSMDICTAICRVFFFTSLYVYSILCSVGRTDKQSSELIYTNECVECVS